MYLQESEDVSGKKKILLTTTGEDRYMDVDTSRVRFSQGTWDHSSHEILGPHTKSLLKLPHFVTKNLAAFRRNEIRRKYRVRQRGCSLTHSARPPPAVHPGITITRKNNFLK